MHFFSEWAKLVKGIDSNKDLDNLKVPLEIEMLIAPLQDKIEKMLHMPVEKKAQDIADIKTNVKKLIKADSFLKTKGKLVREYLEKETANYEAATADADANEGHDEEEEDEDDEDDEEGEEDEK